MLIYQPVKVNCNVLRNSFVQGSVESDNLLLSIGTLVLFSIDVCCISNQHVQKFLRGSPYFCFFVLKFSSLGDIVFAILQPLSLIVVYERDTVQLERDTVQQGMFFHRIAYRLS